MIKPTVGRVVWFWPQGVQPEGAQPHAALVTQVHSDDCVNLAVFYPGGGQYSATSVHLHQDDKAPRPTTPHASWMPYQVGQAKAAAASDQRPRERRPDLAQAEPV